MTGGFGVRWIRLVSGGNSHRFRAIRGLRRGGWVLRAGFGLEHPFAGKGRRSCRPPRRQGRRVVGRTERQDRWPGGSPAPETEVHHLGAAIIDLPSDATCNVGVESAPVGVENLHRSNLHLRRRAADPSHVVVHSSDDAADVSAVAVVVDGAVGFGSVVEERVAIQDLPPRDGMVRRASCVDYTDRDPRAPGVPSRPRLLVRHLIQGPLLGSERIRTGDGRVYGARDLDRHDVPTLCLLSATWPASSALQRRSC